MRYTAEEKLSHVRQIVGTKTHTYLNGRQELCRRYAQATGCKIPISTLWRWVHRFELDGIAGLTDRKSPGRPRKVAR